jgi:hypothetical protein
VANILNKQWSSTGEGDKRRWDTGFGISFAMPSYLDTEEEKKLHMGWYFIYNAEGSSLMPHGMEVSEGKGGWVEPGEVVHLAEQLVGKSTEFSVFEKPISVTKLEQIYGVKASLHHMACLQWHLKVKNKFSCINNPFDMCRSYASGPNQFEVFFKGDDDPYEYMEMEDLFSAIKERYGTPETCCGHCWTVYEEVIKRCSGCKKVHYCGEECQTKDWKGGHSKICKKLQI